MRKVEYKGLKRNFDEYMSPNFTLIHSIVLVSMSVMCFVFAVWQFIVSIIN
jgi:hypothetical protein